MRGNGELMRQYLLGDLDEVQQEKIEERLLTDEELQAQLSDTQDELIDEYAFGLLSDRARKLFEKNFVLSPGRLHKLHVSKAFVQYCEASSAEFPWMQASAPDRPWQRFFHFLQTRKLAVAFGSVIILSIIGYGAWSVYRQQQLRDQLMRLQSQKQKVEQELALLNRTAVPVHQVSVATMTLRPLLRDGGSVNRVGINQGIDILQLRLELDEDKFTAYRAVIETDEGNEIYTVNDLKAELADERSVPVLNLPSRLLPTGSYQIHLSGITVNEQLVDIGRYPFQIVLK
jgi:hypothetical protein